MNDLEEMYLDSFFTQVDDGELIPIPTGGICRVCGCSDLAACPGGCFWVADDLCSACYFEMQDDEELG
jgi:hypothetical protein